MANNIEQKSNSTNPYLNRLHQLTFVQEISVNDIFRRSDGKLFRVLAISNNEKPIIDYQAMEQISYTKRNGKTAYECKPINKKGIIYSLKLRRFEAGVLVYTHSEDELTKVEKFVEK